VILAFSSTPLLGGLVAHAIARLRRAPFVYVVQDVYPDVAVALGVLRPGLLAKVAARVESHTWRSAARLVLISEDLTPVARERGVPADRTRFVSNWADLARILPREESAFRGEMGIGREEFVVQYAGNLGRSQDLDTVLECARLIESRQDASDESHANRGTNPRIRFLFVGEGAREAEVRSRASSAIRIAPFQPADRVGEVLAAADVALVPLKAGLTRYSVPSKVYSILASGRAVGASVDASSEVARIIEDADCGFRVDPGDAEGLAREIVRLAGDPNRARELGRRARAWSERHGALERAALEYESVLTQVAP
jgi:colanic acid biosynthesis glycosyl transferase WcaI